MNEGWTIDGHRWKEWKEEGRNLNHQFVLMYNYTLRITIVDKQPENLYFDIVAKSYHQQMHLTSCAFLTTNLIFFDTKKQRKE